MIFDETETAKRPLINRQDGTGEVPATNVYVNDQDGTGERLVFAAAAGQMIASFEGSEFDDAWGGRKDTVDGDLVTTSARAVDGDNSLRHPADGGYDATRSLPGDGLPVYVGIPSKQRHYVYFDDWTQMNCYWQFCWRNSGNDWVGLRYWGSNDALYFNESVSGSLTTIGRSVPAGVPSDAWLEVTITVNDDTGTYDAEGLLAWEPRVEVYNVDASFARTTLVADFKGSDSTSDPDTISASNRLSQGQGGYRWTFQGSAVMDADYHHVVE